MLLPVVEGETEFMSLPSVQTEVISKLAFCGAEDSRERKAIIANITGKITPTIPRAEKG